MKTTITTTGAGNSAVQTVIYTAPNGWQVRRVTYALRNGRLVPNPCGVNIWFEVYDERGKEFVCYEDGAAPMEYLRDIANTAGGALK